MAISLPVSSQASIASVVTATRSRGRPGAGCPARRPAAPRDHHRREPDRSGAVRLQAGTLYTSLDRLWLAGLVERDREEVADRRLRRYYRLTEAGAELLAAEADRRRASAAVAAQRLSARLAGDAA